MTRFIHHRESTLLSLILLAAFALTACKAVEKYKDSDSFAADCAEAFPVKTDSIYIEGQTVHDTVTTYNYGVDTVVMVVDSLTTKFVYKDRIITKTINTVRVDTFTRAVENTALVTSLLQEINQLEQDAAVRDYRIKRTRKWLWIGWGLALVAVLAFFAVKRR